MFVFANVETKGPRAIPAGLSGLSLLPDSSFSPDLPIGQVQFGQRTATWNRQRWTHGLSAMWTDRHAVLAFGIHVTTMTVRSRVGGDVDHNSAGLGQRLFPWIGRSRDCAFFPSRALCISASCVDALTDTSANG
jgi:hypothetical protein